MKIAYALIALCTLSVAAWAQNAPPPPLDAPSPGGPEARTRGEEQAVLPAQRRRRALPESTG